VIYQDLREEQTKKAQVPTFRYRGRRKPEHEEVGPRLYSMSHLLIASCSEISYVSIARQKQIASNSFIGESQKYRFYFISKTCFPVFLHDDYFIQQISNFG
jgi:hypothetical protein